MKTSDQKKELALKDPEVIRLTALFNKYTRENQSAKEKQQDAFGKFKSAEIKVQQTLEKQRGRWQAYIKNRQQQHTNADKAVHADSKAVIGVSYAERKDTELHKIKLDPLYYSSVGALAAHMCKIIMSVCQISDVSYTVDPATGMERRDFGYYNT